MLRDIIDDRDYDDKLIEKIWDAYLTVCDRLGDFCLNDFVCDLSAYLTNTNVENVDLDDFINECYI